MARLSASTIGRPRTSRYSYEREMTDLKELKTFSSSHNKTSEASHLCVDSDGADGRDLVEVTWTMEQTDIRTHVL